MHSRIRQIQQLGQAVWIDFISRELLRSGRLDQLIAEGVTGMTSNPTIFQKAIAGGREYDEDVRAAWRDSSGDPYTAYESVAVCDICDAADALRPVFDATQGRDGFVSMEVNPKLADDTAGTIAEARRLHGRVARPNLMIKVPATSAGLPAIATLIGEGIHVNVTLIFSLSMHEAVMRSYIDGLRRLQRSGKPVAGVASVASFFISRVDSLVDKLLEAYREDPRSAGLAGKAAVANARLAYARFREIFGGSEFADLRAAGARVQRPLWASTSTKNPAYSPTLYVDTLIGPHTVNTLPPATLEELRKPGVVAQTVEQNLDEARTVLARLQALGIDMTAVTDRLLAEGVKLFVDSFDELLADIERKGAALARA
ncbi:MAG: transaldolase [Phycisphaerales bacterium]|nr:transaldolase [Phycisphaerales bacterium]